MKYIFLITLMSVQTMPAAGGHANAGIVSVGPPAAGDCDFTDIQDAINAVVPATDGIHVVTGTYNETLNLTDVSVELTGGYADCAAAENDERVAGSMSTLDAVAHGMVITAMIDGDSESVIITGFNVINGTGGFINSGGINITGEVDVSLVESRVADNIGSNGGGIYVDNPATLVMHNTVVEDNEAVIGGGVFCDGCSLVVNGASGISDNEANGNGVIDGVGGGLYLRDNAQATILSGSQNPLLNGYGIHSNQAIDLGGGIYVEESELTLFGHLAIFGFGNDTDPASVTNNTAGHAGGGIYITDDSTVNATVVDISNNVSGRFGAGIYISNSSTLNMTLGTNTPLDRCWTADTSKCNRMQGNYIANGSATDGEGGAIRSFSSEVNVQHVWFENNNAGEGIGAAIRHLNSFGSGLSVENSVFYDNGSGTGNDTNVIEVFSGDGLLRFNTIVDNNISDEILHFVGSSDDDFEVRNTIVHNFNSDLVFAMGELGAGGPDVLFDCVLVHNDNSLPASATVVFQGNPDFFDREAGDLHLTSESTLAIDKCGPVAAVNMDIDLEDRQLDLFGVGNDIASFSDIGADEYIGSDANLDIIFADGFE